MVFVAMVFVAMMQYPRWLSS